MVFGDFGEDHGAVFVGVDAGQGFVGVGGFHEQDLAYCEEGVEVAAGLLLVVQH